MKYEHILLAAVAAFSLLAAPGSAMAVDNCEDGVIQDETVRDISVGYGQRCFIIGVKVLGSIVVSDSPAIVIVETDVEDTLAVDNSNVVVLVNNRVQKGRMVVKDSDQVMIRDNDADTAIKAVRNISATVTRNEADRMICRNNTELVAFLNRGRDWNNCDR